jgi:LL-diaminopimelate aminotransferase
LRTFSQTMESLSKQYFATLALLIQGLQAEGMDVIRLDVGSPDLPPPGEVIVALNRSAARPDHHGYQPHKGIPALRRAWADFYLDTFGVELDPETEVLPLSGSKEGIFHIGQVVLEPGDVVLLPDPGYLSYSSGTHFSSGVPYFMPLEESRTYLPMLEHIPDSVARKVRILWLNYPHNPTGAVADLAFFERAVEFARRYGILLLHDAAYSQVTFDGHRAPSVLEVPGAKEVAVEFNTLSKSHNMAGWRTGAALGVPEVLERLYRLKTHADSGQFLPVMEAAAAALRTRREWIETRNEVYRARRDLVASALNETGIEAPVPLAGLYIWFRGPASMTSRQFTEGLLNETGVSLAPGSIFGNQGEGFARLALCSPEARLTEAMSRLARWWRQNGSGGGGTHAAG